MIRQMRKTMSRENLPSPGYTSREVVVKIWGTGLRSPSQNTSIKKERRRKKKGGPQPRFSSRKTSRLIATLQDW